MRKMLFFLIFIAFFITGCTTSTVLVRTLEEPRWPVESSRSINTVAVLQDKRGRNAYLTNDLTAFINDMLKKSAYYNQINTLEIKEGSFVRGRAGEKIPEETTIATLSEKTGSGLLLLIEVIDSKMWMDLGGRVGYSVGFGRWHGNTAFGTSFGSGSEYWNVNARMLIGIALADSESKKVLASKVEDHSFHRTYMDTLPSESDVFMHMVRQASSRIITYVDVYFHLEPRRLRSDGSRLVNDGIDYAMLGGPENWETARQFWKRAIELGRPAPAPHYNLGVAAEIRENYEEAVGHYLNARDIAGVPDAFSIEINQASQSADILAKYGAFPEPVKKQPREQEKTEQD